MTNLFIVGVQKAGTTALHTYLSRHPEIRMSARKELHFFDNDGRDWANPDYAELERGLGVGGVMVRGEATPVYLYWPRALERLRAYDPAARLIVMLRHPVWRAFSHWKMECRRNAETLSFADAVGAIGRGRMSPAGIHRVFSYVERGFYAEQIRRLLALFPREQVHFSRTEDLWRQPRDMLAMVEAFLGVEAALAPANEYIVMARTDHEADVAADLHLRLLDSYAEDILQTAALTGLDLSAWMSLDYAEPMRPSVAA